MRYILVGGYRYFRGTYQLQLQGGNILTPENGGQ
jgi:hypothetical protein